MPIDRWGHSRPDPLFPSAFYNGQEWDMAATGRGEDYMAHLSARIFNGIPSPTWTPWTPNELWNYYLASAWGRRDANP